MRAKTAEPAAARDAAQTPRAPPAYSPPRAARSYVSPNEARAALKRKRGKSTFGHVAQKEKRRERIHVDGVADMPEDELDDVFD